jgi:hypothetical protein
VTHEKHREWQVIPDAAGIEPVLTEFVARRIMKVTRQRPGLIEVKGGSALALGQRAQVLDWLPVRGRIAYGAGDPGYTKVEAWIGPRGRPHLRRRLFEELYEHKLSSWLADLDRTLRAATADVSERPGEIRGSAQH